MNLFDHVADTQSIALRDARVTLSWQQLDEVLSRFANRLQQEPLGDRRRIAVFAENAVETGLANLGGLLGGSSVVPVNFHLTADEAAYILEDSGAAVLFVGPETAERGVEAARQAGVATVVGWRTGNTFDGVVDWDVFIQEGDASCPDLNRKPLPNLLYTSGTTGRPKGTELPPTMFAGGETIREHMLALRESPMAPLGPHIIVGPMYHTGPLSGARILVAGTPSVVMGKFDAEATLAAIARYKTATTVMVPTHFVRMLALPDDVKAKYDMSSLVRVSHTGAKCPVEVKKAMIDWWGPVFTDAYGASEVGTTCMITSEEWLEHPGSVGQSVPPFTAMVLDDDNNEVEAGTEGRLFFKDDTGRGVVYHNDPEKSAAAHIAPGVFTLGEIGYMDKDGYVYITDRFSDMVVSGGVNLYPAEAEQVIIDHDDVLDVACIGVPHAEMGEELKALVIAKDSASVTEAELINFCRDRLSTYKCPRSLEFVADLGRNTMGKINKRKLRAPYWANA